MKKMERLENENEIMRKNLAEIKKVLESVEYGERDSAYYTIGKIESILDWIDIEINIAEYDRIEKKLKNYK